MDKNSIGQFIAALRKANGMTQQNVADRLNVSNKAVSRWERDECAPDISVIPALAELFGVTCDELLKGERITETTLTDKKDQKVDKQIKNLITRTISGFKTLILISLAVSIIGLVCMFGISYGFYRPVIGFAVMLLFEICALAIAVLAVSKTKDIKTDNELFEMADETLISKFNNTLGSLSFIAFFVLISVVILSLPLILVSSDYVNSVIAPYSYFTFFFVGIVLILAFLYLKCKRPYTAWVTDNQLPQESNNTISKSNGKMSIIQIALTVIAGVIFAFAPYMENPDPGFSLFDVCIIVGIACLMASIIYFIISLIRQKENRKSLVLLGIRNILLIPSALIISESHYVVWWQQGYSQFEREDVWHMEYLGFALVSAAFVFIIFSIIDMLIKRPSKL